MALRMSSLFLRTLRDDPSDAEVFIGWGIDGVCTDVPAMMLPLVVRPRQG